MHFMEMTEHGSTEGGGNKQAVSIHCEIIVNAKLVLDDPKLLHCLMKGGLLVGESSNNEVL